MSGIADRQVTNHEYNWGFCRWFVGSPRSGENSETCCRMSNYKEAVLWRKRGAATDPRRGDVDSLFLFISTYLEAIVSTHQRFNSDRVARDC